MARVWTASRPGDRAVVNWASADALGVCQVRHIGFSGVFSSFWGPVHPRGLAGIEQAIRQARENALALIFQAAIQRSNVEDDGALIEQAASALHALNNEVEAHRRSPAEDPMWREVHARVVAVGAAFARLLDKDLADPVALHMVDLGLLDPRIRDELLSIAPIVHDGILKPGVEQIGVVTHDDLHVGREFPRDIAHQLEHALHGCAVVIASGTPACCSTSDW
jgi:hypothetical protein